MPHWDIVTLLGALCALQLILGAVAVQSFRVLQAGLALAAAGATVDG